MDLHFAQNMLAYTKARYDNGFELPSADVASSFIAQRVVLGGLPPASADLNGATGLVIAPHPIAKTYEVLLDEELGTVHVREHNMYFINWVDSSVAISGGELDEDIARGGPAPGEGHQNPHETRGTKLQFAVQRREMTLRVGDRVEVRDGDEEWEAGIVEAIGVEGNAPIVRKNGWFAAFRWEDLRRVDSHADESSGKSGLFSPFDGMPSSPVFQTGANDKKSRALEAKWAKLGSLETYIAAADKGSALAQNVVGAKFAQGNGVPRDDARAAYYFRLAADQGDARGQTNIGILYARGQGCARSDSRAVRLFQLAAKQGFMPAVELLSVMRSEGRGGLVKDDSVENESKRADEPTKLPGTPYDALEHAYGERSEHFKHGNRESNRGYNDESEDEGD